MQLPLYYFLVLKYLIQASDSIGLIKIKLLITQILHKGISQFMADLCMFNVITHWINTNLLVFEIKKVEHNALPFLILTIYIFLKSTSI